MVARSNDPAGTLRGITAERAGYRRRIRVIPDHGRITALLEDDIHSMAVRLTHDGQRVTGVETFLDRMPWNTCPGAAAVLVETFTGTPLEVVTLRNGRKANCTHLHDLAVLAAAHAHDEQETCFDIRVSDPEEGRRDLELDRNGQLTMHWIEQDGQLVSPAELEGRSLLTLREALSSMPREDAEAGRLLQWAGIVAHGRTIPQERQSDATQMPPNCYTFQPERAPFAQRVGQIIDFSRSDEFPGETLRRQLGLPAY